MVHCFFSVMCMSLCVPWFLFTSKHSPEKKMHAVVSNMMVSVCITFACVSYKRSCCRCCEVLQRSNFVGKKRFGLSNVAAVKPK